MNWKNEVIYHLKNYTANKNAVTNLDERLKTKETQKYSLKGQNAEDVRVQNGAKADTLLNIIVECEEIKKQINDLKYEIKWVEKGLKYLDDTELQCITEFYINNNIHAIYVLAKQLNYSNGHIYRIRNDALNKLVMNMYGNC